MDKGIKRKLQSDIVAAANAKDAHLAFQLFEGYKDYVGEVNANVLSSLFRSLAKREDEKYLEELMEFIRLNKLKLTESEYKSAIITTL